jgi:hypothetical protein
MNEVPLNEVFDGSVWAKEFMKMNFKPQDIDEELMRAWFCNAIMCGYDYSERKKEQELTKLRACLEDAEKVIAFYAGGKNGCNYRMERPHVYCTLPDDDCDTKNDHHSDNYTMIVGGKRAREFQTKFAEIIAELAKKEEL